MIKFSVADQSITDLFLQIEKIKSKIWTLEDDELEACLSLFQAMIKVKAQIYDLIDQAGKHYVFDPSNNKLKKVAFLNKLWVKLSKNQKQ